MMKPLSKFQPRGLRKGYKSNYLDDNTIEKPRGIITNTTVVMPNTDEIQVSKWPGNENINEISNMRRLY